MQRPGIEAIRTQIQPSKPKQDITKITNSEDQKELAAFYQNVVTQQPKPN